jgi:SAM-dependent methyltransferase
VFTIDLKNLDLKPGYRVLDAGCGGGRHLSEAFRYRGVSVVGIDYSRTDSTKARNTLRLMEHEGEDGDGAWEVFVGDVTSLPFKNESFDLVICSEVLEHIPDHKKAVQEIIRVLKPGKILAVSVPRHFPESICWMLSEAYHNEPGGHIRIYKKKEIIDLLESSGVKCISTGWAHALHSPYWWLKCLVGHKNDDFWLVKLYHRFLVWDIMKKPKLTRIMEKLLNPLIAKSVVLYLEKGGCHEA